jgi:uncharacterized coiled-coil protein SlyX
MRRIPWSKTFLLLLAATLPAMSVQAATDAEAVARLERQLAAQQAMIDEQQRMLQSMADQLAELKSSPVVVVEDESEPDPGESAKPDAGTFKVNYYGHLQTDSIYDFKRVDPTYESTLRPSNIPTQSGTFGDDGRFIQSVKQTQIGFKGELPTRVGTVKSWFEFDLFGTGGSSGDTAFNFRHGWVELGGLGFGQTNSNFMDISIFPNVVDWWGPSGMIFNRNPQVRYTWQMEQSHLAVALEKPNGSFNVGIFGEISPEFGEAASANTPLPDLTAHYRMNRDWGHLQLAGVLRQLEFETNGTPGNDPSDDEVGWGLNFTGSFNLFERDQIKFGLVHGEGIASFFNDGGTNLAPQNFKAEAVPHTGYTLYYDRYWNDSFSTSLGFSVNDADTRNQQSAGEFDKGTYASTNLLYTPDSALLFGLEFLFGEHEDVAGRTGRDYRAQFTMKHRFGGSTGY